MAKRQAAYGTRWIMALLIAAMMSVGVLAARPAAAGKLEELDTSLRLIPADTAFYSSMLRNREQVEVILNSKAFARVKEMPIVQMGLGMYQLQTLDSSSPVGQFDAAIHSPQGERALALVADMFSNDVFVYGGKNTVGFIDLTQQIVGAMRYGPAVLQLTGQMGPTETEQIQAALLFNVLAENSRLIRTPDMIFGFKVKDKELANEHLQMLDGLLTMATSGNPDLDGRYKRTKVGEHEFLTLSLDGSMIPWDEAPLDELRMMELAEGDVDKVMAKLKKLKVVISLGLRDDYLLLAVGSSTDALAQLGEGKLLAGRKEFKPLEKMADRRLTSISYVSKALAAKLGTGEKDIEDVLALVNELLPAAGLPEEQETRIRNDAAALAADIKAALPKPGATMGFTFMTEEGMEGYTYNWGGQPQWDGSKPLSLLEHVGGSPILALVARAKTSPESYDTAVKWLKVGYGYFEDFVKPQLREEEREQYEQVAGKVAPLLARLDNANRTLLIPALADGQSGLVLDAKLTSKQFHESLPSTEKAMPMVEPALLVGVSDAAALVKAMGEYRAVVNGLIDVARDIEPGAVPPFEVPPPMTEKIKGGTMYYYPLPAELGLDEQIMPNAGVAEDVAVITASRDHTARLLTATPPKLDGVLEGAEKRPLTTAFSLNWTGLIEAVTPWIDLAAATAIQEELGDADSEQAKSIMDQVHTGIDVAKCLKSMTSESYFEDGVMVTHSLTKVEDLK